MKTERFMTQSINEEVATLYNLSPNRIIVDAKYNIGDEVWFADYFYDTFYPCKHPGKIDEIEISITSNQMGVYYWIAVDYEDGIGYEKYSETACFGSYEECAEWCDKRNIGTKGV